MSDIMRDIAELTARAKEYSPGNAHTRQIIHNLADALAAMMQEIGRLNNEIRSINDHTSACSVGDSIMNKDVIARAKAWAPHDNCWGMHTALLAIIEAQAQEIERLKESVWSQSREIERLKGKP
jgi:hypothetical protein